MNRSSIDVMNRGMQCLMEKLGIVEAGQFIYLVKAEQLDYTKWQREHFDEMSKDETEAKMLDYEQKNPFKGDPKVVI